jgi:hypothetical protein
MSSSSSYDRSHSGSDPQVGQSPWYEQFLGGDPRVIRTPPNVEERIRAMMAAKTPLERLRIASRMFATVRALATAGEPVPEADRRVHLFLRLYARDFPEAERERIVGQLTHTSTA